MANPLDDDDKAKKGGDEGAAPDVAAIKEADPDVTKDPEEAPDAEAPVKKAKKKPRKKLPPWLNKPTETATARTATTKGRLRCKSATDHLGPAATAPATSCAPSATPPRRCCGPVRHPRHDPAPSGSCWNHPAGVHEGRHPRVRVGCGGCPGDAPGSPAPGTGRGEIEAFEKDTGLSDGDRETPTRLEAPIIKSSPEVAAILRFRAVGIDPELGRLHDLTCPAYHPDDVQRCHPFLHRGPHRRDVAAEVPRGRLRPDRAVQAMHELGRPRRAEGRRPGGAERLPAGGAQGVP